MEKAYDNVHVLAMLPVNDGNFTSTLNRATKDEIKKAIENMNGVKGNKGRIAACEKEIRKRDKAFKKANLHDKIILLLKENNITGTVWEDSLNVIKIRIDNGDWKQMHKLCDFIIKEYLHPISMYENIIDDTNSKYYSSVHTYNFE